MGSQSWQSGTTHGLRSFQKGVTRDSNSKSISSSKRHSKVNSNSNSSSTRHNKRVIVTVIVLVIVVIVILIVFVVIVFFEAAFKPWQKALQMKAQPGSSWYP